MSKKKYSAREQVLNAFNNPSSSEIRTNSNSQSRAKKDEAVDTINIKNQKNQGKFEGSPQGSLSKGMLSKTIATNTYANLQGAHKLSNLNWRRRLENLL